MTVPLSPPSRSGNATRSGAVWIDGDLGPLEAGTIAVTDPGLMLGHGVFETTRVLRGAPFAIHRHLRRLRRSASIARMPVPWTDEELRGACAATIAAFEDRGGAGDGQFGRLRLTITAAGRAIVVVIPAPEWPSATTLASIDSPINERSAIAGAKTTSQLDNVWCRDEASRLAVGEVIRTNTAGVLCEGASTNLFLVLDDELVTPALSTGCLAGITRALVLETVGATERDDLTVEDLGRASEVFVTSATRGIHPAAYVDGRKLRAPGPRTATAQTALNVLMTATTDP